MQGVLHAVAATLATPPPGAGDLMSELPNYLNEMQSTIASLAAFIAFVTVVATVLGVGVTAAGLLQQRNIKNEIKDFDSNNKLEIKELKKEINDRIEKIHNQILYDLRERHDSHVREMNLLRDDLAAHTQVAVAKMREEMFQSAERVGNLYLSEFKHKMLDVETAYGSNMKAVEDILMSFQEECVAADPAGPDRFDFPRYNTFRHLLTKLVVGTKPDVSGSLGRLFVEYASNIGEYPGRSLRAFVAGLMDADRIARADQRILAMRLIAELDRRFPPAEVDES